MNTVSGPQPVAWQRSGLIPGIVFVVHPGGTTCRACVFGPGTGLSGCGDHPCKDGVWVTEVDAAILRLEE